MEKFGLSKWLPTNLLSGERIAEKPAHYVCRTRLGRSFGEHEFFADSLDPRRSPSEQEQKDIFRLLSEPSDQDFDGMAVAPLAVKARAIGFWSGKKGEVRETEKLQVWNDYAHSIAQMAKHESRRMDHSGFALFAMGITPVIAALNASAPMLGVGWGIAAGFGLSARYSEVLTYEAQYTATRANQLAWGYYADETGLANEIWASE